MRTETVKLAGKEYEIRELPLRRNAEWRQRVGETFQAFAGLVGETQQMELADTANVLELVRRGGEMVFHAPDTIVELTLAYSPDLQKALAGDVYESELMEAFAACLRLAFPFGRVTRLLGSLMINGSVPKAAGET